MFMGYSDACGIGGWQSDGGFGGGVWVQKWCWGGHGGGVCSRGGGVRWSWRFGAEVVMEVCLGEGKEEG